MSEQVQSLQSIINLEGKNAIVTGGAMGIGRAISYRLAEAGASVMIADIALDQAEATATEFNSMGWKCKAARCDVSKKEDIKEVIEKTVSEFGSIDILVNNAGIYPMKGILQITDDLWNRVMSINVNGVFFFSQLTAQKMKEQNRGGIIINLASIDGFHPTGNLVHYDTSKGGVVMMTKAMALELAHFGIRVNAVAPGGINTEGSASASADSMKAMLEAGMSQEDIMQAFMARIPVKRMGVPDDIGKAVLFLATDLSGYMTGQTIIVDGGYLLS